MNAPTVGAAPTATYTAREAEVPAAAWYNGAALAQQNTPGIGINVGGGAITGEPQQFTLLDQNGAARTPQKAMPIGGTGYTNIANYPSSGGDDGATAPGIETVVPSATGDGTVTVDGTANLAALATGWTKL